MCECGEGRISISNYQMLTGQEPPPPPPTSHLHKSGRPDLACPSSASEVTAPNSHVAPALVRRDTPVVTAVTVEGWGDGARRAISVSGGHIGRCLSGWCQAYPTKLSDIWTSCVMNLALPLPFDEDPSVDSPCLETAAVDHGRGDGWVGHGVRKARRLGRESVCTPQTLRPTRASEF